MNEIKISDFNEDKPKLYRYSRISDSLIPVRPMTGPSGLVFYLRWKYSENKGSKLNEIDSDK